MSVWRVWRSRIRIDWYFYHEFWVIVSLRLTANMISRLFPLTAVRCALVCVLRLLSFFVREWESLARRFPCATSILSKTSECVHVSALFFLFGRATAGHRANQLILISTRTRSLFILLREYLRNSALWSVTFAHHLGSNMVRTYGIW